MSSSSPAPRASSSSTRERRRRRRRAEVRRGRPRLVRRTALRHLPDRGLRRGTEVPRFPAAPPLRRCRARGPFLPSALRPGRSRLAGARAGRPPLLARDLFHGGPPSGAPPPCAAVARDGKRVIATAGARAVAAHGIGGTGVALVLHGWLAAPLRRGDERRGSPHRPERRTP